MKNENKKMRGPGTAFRFVLPIASLTALLVSVLNLAAANSNSAAPTNAPSAKPEPPPTTPREFFNAGSQKLREGKLREAEAFLQSALARQNERVQPPTLYNLGHVRFAQGLEELKKSLSAKPTAARGRAAAQRSDPAIQQAADALAGHDVQKMVAAYQNGRGVRKELKAAAEAVRRALDLHGAALRKWQRALGDFKSASELNPADAEARHNAEIVERAIAKLVDSIVEMQQVAMGMSPRERELAEKLKQLKGQIPEPFMPPGAAGDDEDDEDGKGRPPEIKPGDKEGASKEGEEIMISPETAAWLLEGFKLDAERRLPMGQGEQGKQQDRAKRNW
jgi:tetratricopeptide (TPR) repeat protein